MKSALLLVLLLVFAMGGTAAATTWTINVPEFVGEGTGPWVTWTGYGADGNDAWSRNNPGADWAQAHYHFGFGDIPTTPTPMLVEYWCPAVPPECPANWGPITFAGGAKWWGADMGPRSGSWRAIGDAGFGPGPVPMTKGDWLYYLWNPWGGGYANVAAGVRITGIPEPSSLLALLAGMPALALLRRKR